MKKLLLILLCLPMIGFGQTTDILRLQNEVNNINYRMDKHHKQFYNGVTLTIIGVGVTIIGVVVPVVPLIIIGGGSAIAGNIIIVNSHKWFKKGDYHTKRIKKRIKQLDKWLETGELKREEYDVEINKMNKLLKQ